MNFIIDCITFFILKITHLFIIIIFFKNIIAAIILKLLW